MGWLVWFDWLVGGLVDGLVGWLVGSIGGLLDSVDGVVCVGWWVC